MAVPVLQVVLVVKEVAALVAVPEPPAALDVVVKAAVAADLVAVAGAREVRWTWSNA